MFTKCFIFVCALFGTYEAAYVDSLHACPMKDQKCLIDLVHSALQDLGPNGIQEFNMAPIDPLEIKDLSIPVLNLMNITIVEGKIKGLKDCVVSKFDIRAEKGKSTVEMLCNMEIKGKNKIRGSSPELATLLGSKSIHADGNFNIKFSKLQATLIFRYKIVKQDDGELHFKFDNDQFRYKYVLGGFHMDADNIYVGENDASKFIVDYMNSNWQFLIKSFGNNFFDVAMKIMNDMLGQLSENVACKYFINDDLTSFVKND